jgi:hypothetical protein
MKSLQILYLTVMVIATAEAIQVENYSTSNAYIDQITALRDNSPYYLEDKVIIGPDNTVGMLLDQKVIAFHLKLGNNSEFDISTPFRNKGIAKVTINKDGSVVVSKGVEVKQK